MNSSFAIIAGGCPWPRSRHCSASGPDANRHIMSRYAVLQTFLSLTTTYWELLKQPDKQNLAKQKRRRTAQARQQTQARQPNPSLGSFQRDLAEIECLPGSVGENRHLRMGVGGPAGFWSAPVF